MLASWMTQMYQFADKYLSGHHDANDEVYQQLVVPFWALKIHSFYQGKYASGLEVLIPSIAIWPIVYPRLDNKWYSREKFLLDQLLPAMGEVTVCYAWKLPRGWTFYSRIGSRGQHDVLWVSLDYLDIHVSSLVR